MCHGFSCIDYFNAHSSAPLTIAAWAQRLPIFSSFTSHGWRTIWTLCRYFHSPVLLLWGLGYLNGSPDAARLLAPAPQRCRKGLHQEKLSPGSLLPGPLFLLSPLASVRFPSHSQKLATPDCCFQVRQGSQEEEHILTVSVRREPRPL